MENMFAADKNGSPGLTTFAGETHPGLLWGVLLWQSFNLDAYGQYYAGSPYGGRNFWGVFDALSQARKKGGPVFKTMPTQWPMGTVVGIQTMWRIPSFVDSLRPLDAPAVPIMPVLYGGGIGKINAQALKDYAPGFTVELYIFGVYYNRVKVTLTERFPGEWHADYQILIEEFGAPACQYYIENQPKGASPYFIRLGVVLAEHEEQGGFEAPLLYHLYHTKKINAKIYPPHNTALFPGTSVRILAEPRADRVLTEFTVQTVDRLAEATTEYADTTAKGITSPYGYDDTTKAKYTYGPVNSDVYVTAVAEGVEIEEEIQAGIEQTIQMTTTDCLVEEGSWSITGTSLPEDVEYSIDADGLITVLVPEDVYDGNPGGRYYIDVQFEGYSQTKALRVWVTVAPVAAYGTVWTAAGTLAEAPIAAFEASDGTLYITTAAKVYKTADLVTYDEVSLTGTPTGRLGNIVESANGRLVMLETDSGAFGRGRVWIKDPEDEGFTRQDAWPGIHSGWKGASTWVAGHPDSEVVLYGASTSYTATNCLLTARNSVTGAILHTLDVARGTIARYAMPAIRLDDNTWLISVIGKSVYKVYRYTEGTGFAEVLSGTCSWDSYNILYREPNNRVVLIGNEDNLNWFKVISTDGGATWTDKEVTKHGQLNDQTLCVAPLKKGYLVLGTASDRIFRSTDTLATATEVANLGGDVIWLLKRATAKLVALVNRTGGTNIWKSEA